MSKLTDLSLTEVLDGLQSKNFSEQELNKDYQDRINEFNKDLNVYITTEDGDKGIPAAIKDAISTKGIQTTAGSKILEGYTPVYNATVIEKLLSQNIRIIGKTNMDEFAMGSSGENSAYGLTSNPWDKSKVPGGSSSGSAVAVAADLAVFSLGSDTGGSIRQPASLCGVVGLKPSYGNVSRYGLIAMASSLDQIGPFTKTVKDSRKVFEWISGSDGFDSNTWDHPYEPSESRKDLKGLRVGLPKEYFSQGLNVEVKKVVTEAIQKLEQLGATVVEISLPHTEYAIACYYVLMASEVSSNLARFDGIRFGKTRDFFGEETKRRIMLGTFALSTGYFDDYFIKAAKVRTLIESDFSKAFKVCDVIAGPVSPTVAWNKGEKIADPLTMYLSDIYTVPVSLAGFPAISIPCGFADNMPVGLQLIARYSEENTLFDVGEIYEESTNWNKEKPKL